MERDTLNEEEEAVVTLRLTGNVVSVYTSANISPDEAYIMLVAALQGFHMLEDSEQSSSVH